MKPDRAPFPPIQFQKNPPPAKKKKYGKAERGEGGRAVLRAWRRSSDHAIEAYDEISSHHARGACEAGSVAKRLEIGSSGAVYSHHHRNFQKIGRIFALVFFAPHQRKPVRFGRAARLARVEGGGKKFKSRKFLEGGFFQGQVSNS